MKIYAFIVLCAFIMTLQTPETSGNILLGTTGGSGSSSHASNSGQTRYTNNNGIVESYETYSNYEQKPDGSCIKRVVEVRNGRKQEKEIPINCEAAKEEIRKNGEKTQAELRKHQEEVEQHHRKIMEEQRKISDSIKLQMRSMNRNFNFF